MKLSELEKLVNFCNKVIIQNNNETQGLCAYFEYKDVQYYASMLFDKHTGQDFAIFPALDKSVKSWINVYHNDSFEEVTRKTFREEIFNFLLTLN